MGQPEQRDFAAELDAAAVEAKACPECTANRGEHCRDRTGATVETHPSRLGVYARDEAAAEGRRQADELLAQTQQPAETKAEAESTTEPKPAADRG